jgi:hypothetical protein
MDFDKENAWQKAWGVVRAPAVIGCDLHGNEFAKAGVATLDTVRNMLKGMPDLVAKYEASLKLSFGRAMDALKGDEEKGLKALVDLCLIAKPGYKETAEAGAKLAETAEAALRKGELAEAVGVDVGISYHDDLVKVLRTTPPGIHAEIRREAGPRARQRPARHRPPPEDPETGRAHPEEGARGGRDGPRRDLQSGRGENRRRDRGRRPRPLEGRPQEARARLRGHGRGQAGRGRVDRPRAAS